MSNSTQGFYSLQPDLVLQAVESLGFYATGHLAQLNSYENRVFDIGIESQLEAAAPSASDKQERVIAKFYRPNRWNKSAIQAEHNFLFELKQQEIGVVAPLKIKDQSVFEFQGLLFSVFPKFRGRMPDELTLSQFEELGRIIARVHNIGSEQTAMDRPSLDTNYYGGWQNLEFLQNWIAPEIRDRYNEAASFLLETMDEVLDPSSYIRIHGDCHRGNILLSSISTPSGYKDLLHLVDFDDFCNGPAVQDLWMLLPGEGPEVEQQQEAFFKGYEELREFPYEQLDWIPLLRAWRIMGYAGWIAKRWDDPSFPVLFPEFNSYTYWAEECEALEQLAWQLSDSFL